MGWNCEAYSACPCPECQDLEQFELKHDSKGPVFVCTKCGWAYVLVIRQPLDELVTAAMDHICQHSAGSRPAP